MFITNFAKHEFKTYREAVRIWKPADLEVRKYTYLPGGHQNNKGCSLHYVGKATRDLDMTDFWTHFKKVQTRMEAKRNTSPSVVS